MHDLNSHLLRDLSRVMYAIVVRLSIFLMIFLGVWACESPISPPELDPPRPIRKSVVIRVAGAAIATPLLVRLINVFGTRDQGTPVVVVPPIGSTGALRALSVERLDAALVVQASGKERPAGAVLLARTRAMLVAGSRVRTRSMTLDELIATLNGSAPTWRTGVQRRILLRPSANPLQHAFGTEPRVAQALASGAQRWGVIHQEVALRDALRRTPGAITVLDSGSLSLAGLPVWPIRVEGLADAWLDVLLIPGDKPSPTLLRLLSFATGPQGRALVTELGYRAP